MVRIKVGLTRFQPFFVAAIYRSLFPHVWLGLLHVLDFPILTLLEFSKEHHVDQLIAVQYRAVGG